jgi:hypothetical protein
MPDEPARIAREKRTVGAMIRLYCRANHGTSGELCEDCRGLSDYAMRRLECCRFGAEKPTCADCPVHCYKPAMRERVQMVMRFAGPRMLFRHPYLALMHLWDGRRAKNTNPKRERG